MPFSWTTVSLYEPEVSSGTGLLWLRWPSSPVPVAQVTELLQHVQKNARHMLAEVQEPVWSDLRPAQRASAGTSLVLGIEENAFLVADTVTTERNLVKVTENILSSVRVISIFLPTPPFIWLRKHTWS